MAIAPILNKINQFILNPLIILMFAVALLVLFWGLFQFITSAETDEGREKGKRNILWGVIGMVIMVSVYGIIRLILGTLGVPTAGLYGF